MKILARYLTHRLRSKWNKGSFAIAVALGMAICCSNVLAQSGAGVIQGTVTDSTGAVIAGVSIRVVKQDTNVVSTAKTNGVGFYQVPGLFTGTYVVTYTVPSMKTYKATIELQVARTAVVNTVMTAGAVTQEVEVAANTVQLTTTDNGTIGSTLENERINQLPMNGRLLMTLASETTPGLELTSLGERSNGLTSEALEYVADGVPMSNRGFGGQINSTQGLLPDPDAVQEVHMETSNSSAMYATPATGIITTKSGTNSLHGSFFETARNNAIGIAKARQDPANFAAPHLVRNEFGVSAGGPIILPHVYHGKDKSFWFFAYERYSLAQTAYARYKVPTLAMKRGDFSGLVNSSGVLQQLYDPATTHSSTNCNGTGVTNKYCRTPFVNNQIPISRLNPLTKILYDMTPAPTTTDNPLVAGNYDFPGPTYNIVPTITFRLDHSFNENNKAYLRYTSANQYYTYPGAFATTLAADGISAAAASSLTILPNSNFGAAMGYTHVFSPTFYSETILSQQWFNQITSNSGDVHRNYEAELGLPNNFGGLGFPGIGGSIMPHAGNMYHYGISQIITNLDENLTKIIGRHQMQFGARYRHERLGYQSDERQDNVGVTALTTGLENPTSGANYTATPNTGYAEGDLFLGSAGSYAVNLSPPFSHYHDMELDGYFQDNYHMNEKLTLNLGFRYEAHPAMSERDGLISSFDIKNHAEVLTHPTSYYVAKGYTTQAIITNLQNIGVVFETSSGAGFPSSNLNSFNFTIGPRLGFAYLPFGNKYGTVIRGGYGRYIYPAAIRNTVQNTGSNPPFFQRYTQDYNVANQSPDGQVNYLVRNSQYSFMGVNSANAVDTATTSAILPGIGGSYYDPNFAPIYVTQTNFTIEQPLKGNSALRLTWLWSHGANLDHGYYPNNHPSNFVWEMATGTLPPTGGAATIGTNQYAATATGPYNQTTYGSFNYSQRNGWSNDNALQVNYQRQFRKGIAYQIAYVWSRAFRVGGNSTRDSLTYPAQNYLGVLGTVGSYTSPYGPIAKPASPPTQPSGVASYDQWKELMRFEDYMLDSAIPLQHITFNGVVDLPFGRGKRFLGNSNRFMNLLIGGFQLAGAGSIVSQAFQPASTNWGATNPLKMYKHKQPVTDCRSGVCQKSFLWFNGYIAPGVIDAATKGVSGLPSDYVANSPTSPAYLSPIDTTPGTPNYGTNNVLINLNKGQTPSTIAFSPGPGGNNPYDKSFIHGPMNWTVDLSVFKVFPITEKVNLRLNLDAFNALNVQGYNNPNTTDGIQSLLTSHNTPRQMQLTVRLTY